MEHIRYLHISAYSAEHRRFKSYAFQNSDDDSGISVVGRACAEAHSGNLCVHGRTYYGPPHKVTGEPPIFVPVDPELLYPGCLTVPVVGETGDPCHSNLKGITPSNAGK